MWRFIWFGAVGPWITHGFDGSRGPEPGHKSLTRTHMQYKEWVKKMANGSTNHVRGALAKTANQVFIRFSRGSVLGFSIKAANAQYLK